MKPRFAICVMVCFALVTLVPKPSKAGTKVTGACDLHWRLFVVPQTQDGILARSSMLSVDSMLCGPACELGDESVNLDGRKSKVLAVVLSAAIPGAGEVYCGSYLKGAGFLLAEGAFWVLRGKYVKDGDRIEDEFHQFADTHWIEDEYWDWISAESGIDRDDMEALRAWEGESFSHSLHREKDQQYYEMIGKYDQFNYGWDDTDTPRGRDSARRDHYETLRNDSNKAFKKASSCEMVILANHVLSMLDAAWTVSRHNKRVVHTSLRITPSRFTRSHDPMLTLRVDW